MSKTATLVAGDVEGEADLGRRNHIVELTPMAAMTRMTRAARIAVVNHL
jgi:hypothetical protein